MTDAEIEQLEKQANASRSLTDQEISALESQSAPQQEKPWYDRGTEAVFGEGPKHDMSFTERLNRVGRAGLGGTVAGGALGSIIPGAGTLTGAGLGGVAGMLGEVGEQASEVLGGGRAAQVGTNMVAGGLTEPVINAVPALLKFGSSKLLGIGGRGLVKDLTPGLENDANIRQAVLNARESLLSGRNPLEANATLGGIFQDADVAARNALNSTISQKQSTAASRVADLQRQAEEEIARKTASAATQNTALQQQQFAAEQAKNAAASQLRQTQEAGLGKGESLYNLGDQLRTKVIGRYVPALKTASEQYGVARDAAMNSAKQAEESGQFWAATPEALKIRDKWIKDLTNREDSASRDVRNLIDQIWGTKTISKEVVDEVASAQTGTPVMKTIQEKVPNYASAEKIDDIVRKLGEAYGKDSVTGFDAIKTGLAKDLRKDLTHGADRQGTGGFYEWSGLGSAKTAYKDALESNAAVKNSLGDTLIAKDVDRATFIKDPEKVIKEALSSTDSINKLVQLVGPKDAEEAITKYAISSIENKTPAQVQEWLNAHRHMGDNNSVGKSVYAAVDNHFQRLKGLESSVTKADEAIAGIKQRIVPEDVLSKFKKERLDAVKSQQNEITAATNSEIEQVKSLLKTTGLLDANANRIASPSDLGEKLWSKTLTDDNINVIGSTLKSNPSAQTKVFDSAAYMLSRTNPADLPYSLGRVETLLRGMGITDQKALDTLRQQTQQIIEASHAKKIDSTAQLKAMFKRAMLQNVPSAVAGSQTNRLFEAFRKKEQ